MLYGKISMIKKTEKFKLNKDFRIMYGKGKCFVDSAFVSYIRMSNRDHSRMGITVSKKLGGAVERNRAKRVISAAWREICPRLTQNADVVFVARTRLLTLKSTQVAAIMLKHFEGAGLIVPEEK